MEEMFNKALRSEQREEGKPADNTPLLQVRERRDGCVGGLQPCWQLPASRHRRLTDAGSSSHRPRVSYSRVRVHRNLLFLGGFGLYCLPASGAHLSAMAHVLGIFHLSTELTWEQVSKAIVKAAELDPFAETTMKSIHPSIFNILSSS